MKRTVWLCMCATWILAQTAAATTYTVGPGGGYNFTTIQAAINAATTGDVVIVHPATYVENVQFRGRSIVLRTTDPTSPPVVAATVIDGGSTGSVVTFAGTENATCTVAGFYITNGRAALGAGVCGNGALATIEYNVITSNSSLGLSDTYGAGIFDCDGLIRHNVIQNNWIDGGNTTRGGGLAFCDGVIQYTTVTGNWVRAAGGSPGTARGGGFFGCNGLIRLNTISNNRTLGTGFEHGGGIAHCEAVIESNTVTGNRSYYGGGISYSTGTLRGNLIANNVSTERGGGVNGFSGPILQNVIRNNSSKVGGGLHFCPGLISNNEICRNTASQAAGGLSLCSGTIESNWITTNTASAFDHARGGGLYDCDGLIQNNTISGNVVSGGDAWGGGMYGCDGLIQNNLVTRNTTIGRDENIGAGIAVSSGTIRGNVISLNAAISNGPYPSDPYTGDAVGGGLVNCDGLVQNNLITSNSVTSSGRWAYGGGMAILHGVVEGNTIVGNTVRGALWVQGGGIWGRDTMTIRNNIIVGNSCQEAGGGIFGPANGSIENNTIHGNTANTRGGGISDSGATVRNCIVWGNTAPTGAQVYQSGTPSYSCIQNWPGGGTGNITDNPLFVDAANNNFHLQTISPCIDAGGTVALTADFEDNYRPIHFLPVARGDGSWFDIGADEVATTQPYMAVSPSSLRNTTALGSDAPTHTLVIWNGSGGTLVYTLETTPAWLSAIPLVGVSDGPASRTTHRILYDTDLLPAGSHVGSIKITDAAAYNSPVVVPVRVIIRGAGSMQITVGPGAGFDFATIQEAIDAAFNGDEIVVAPGTYPENIRFLGKNIVLRSTDPASTPVVASTIIDGRSLGSVVTFSGTEGATCVLSGFTITRGLAPRGAGILGNGAHATLQYNVISNNIATGGGITSNGGAAYDFDGIIRSNEILDNTAGRDGGALYFCEGVIEGNRFLRNSAPYGGTVCWSGTATIRGNMFRENHVGGGGGIYGNYGVVENNLISSNTASNHGGGLAHCYGTIRNNTIVGNHASNNGGGVVLSPGAIVNCIVWGNTAPSEPQISSSATPSYSCIQNWSGGGTGNIAADPLFVSSAQRDYHLQEISPCIDAGGTVTLATDFEGDPRPVNFVTEPRGDGTDFDIGADEVIITSPTIAFAPDFLRNATFPGVQATTQTITVWNRGTQPLGYILDTSPTWLTAAPAFGFSDGPSSRNVHQIGYQSAALAMGDHAGTITITDPAAINSPQRIPVWLRVYPVLFTSPAGGEQWTAGRRYEVVWESAGGAPSGVWLFIVGPGVNQTLRSAPNVAGTNRAWIRLPAWLPAGGGYEIRASWNTGPLAIIGRSYTFSMLAAPTFAITSPAPGATWQLGMPSTFTFTCADLPASGQAYVILRKGGVPLMTWGRVPCQNGNNTVFVRLPLSFTPASDYQIGLVWLDDPMIGALSSQFTLIGPPTFVVTSPTSTSVWQARVAGALVFTAANLPAPGQVWVTVWRGQTPVLTWGRIGCQNGENGAMIRLPSTLTSGTYQLRLMWVSNTAVQGWSLPFRLESAPVFNVTWPATGSTWKRGTAANIRWNAANLVTPSQVHLELWQGTQWKRYFGLYSTRNGDNSVSVTLPTNLNTGAHRVRLLWEANTGVGDWGDVFTVQ